MLIVTARRREPSDLAMHESAGYHLAATHFVKAVLDERTEPGLNHQHVRQIVVAGAVVADVGAVVAELA